MRSIKYTLILTFLVLMVLTPCTWAGSLQNGITAYNRGDYATAMKLLKPLAKKGNANAQYALGRMYERGQGVGINKEDAMEWFLKAANQNHAKAQSYLSYMYWWGNGVRRDYGKSYMWLLIAAGNGNTAAKKQLENASVALSPERLAEAKKMAAEWQAKHPR